MQTVLGTVDMAEHVHLFERWFVLLLGFCCMGGKHFWLVLPLLPFSVSRVHFALVLGEEVHASVPAFRLVLCVAPFQMGRELGELP